MAKWLRQSTAIEVKHGPYLDSTDGTTPEPSLSLTMRVSKNEGDWANKSDATAPVHEEFGYYRVLLNTTDTNTAGILRIHSAPAGAFPVFDEYMVLPQAVYDTLVAGGTGLRTTVGAMESNVVTNAAIATDAISAGKVASSAVAEIQTGLATSTEVGDVQTNLLAATGDIQSRLPSALVSGRMDSSVSALADGLLTTAKFAAGAIDATVIGTGAIDADALATSAVSEIASAITSDTIVLGTATGGSSTTIVDTARTEAATDYWKGNLVQMTSGPNTGQVRLITAFDATTDTLTVHPAFTSVVGAGNTYKILPNGAVPEVTGAVGSVTAGVSVGVGGIAATSFASGAIGASAIAANAITNVKIADNALTEQKFITGALSSRVLDSTAVTEIQAGLATSAALATLQTTVFDGLTNQFDQLEAVQDTVDSLVVSVGNLPSTTTDAVWDALRSEHSTVGTFGQGVASVQGNVTGTVASVVGAVGSVAAGGIAAASLAAGAANKIADHVFRRSYASARVSSDGDALSFRSLLGAIGVLVNPWRIVGSTLTHYQEDGTTAAGTKTITTAAGAEPITRVE